jgi:hypothetical protein
MLIAPTEGEIIEGRYTFKVAATDIVGVKDVQLYIDGIAYAVVYNIQTGVYELTINTHALIVAGETTADGMHAITVEVVDYAGHTTTIDPPINFFVDNSIPELWILYPTPNAILSGVVKCEILAEDWNIKRTGENNTKYVVMLVDDREEYLMLEAPDGISYFEYNTTALKDGEHKFTFITTDTAGHEVSKSVTVIVDNELPPPPIIPGLNGQYIEGIYTFKIAIATPEDIDRVILLVTNLDLGKPVKELDHVQTLYNGQTQYFEYTVTTTMLPDGNYSAYARAYDLAGNTISMKDEDIPIFFIDNHVPIISIISPYDGEAVAGSSATISVQVEDRFINIVEYMIDNTGWVTIPLIGDFGTITWETTQFSNGEHTITLRAWDLAGHYAEETVTVLVDNTEPQVNIISPRIGEHIGGAYELRVRVDNPLEIVTVFYYMDKNESLGQLLFKDPGTDLYIAMIDTRGIGLTDGQHTITVVAESIGHQVGTAERAVTIDNEGPTLRIDTPKRVGDKITFKVHVTDALSSVAYVYIQIDDRDWVEMSYTGVEDTYVYIWTTTEADAGIHTYRIRAIDDLGNEAIKGTEPRTISITYPPDYWKATLESIPLVAFIFVVVLLVLFIFFARRGKLRALFPFLPAREESIPPPTRRKREFKLRGVRLEPTVKVAKVPKKGGAVRRIPSERERKPRGRGLGIKWEMK